jgi:hypothetical protein
MHGSSFIVSTRHDNVAVRGARLMVCGCRRMNDRVKKKGAGWAGPAPGYALGEERDATSPRRK